jgi:hypothetical protein
MKAAMVAAGNKGGKRACTHPRPTDARHACRTDGSAAPYRKRTAPNLPDGSTELADAHMNLRNIRRALTRPDPGPSP